jgi:hypothetical protein
MVQTRVTDANFIDVTRALNDSGIPYFIGGGTLLRLHRDGDFAPETGDIDICFREGDGDQRQLERILRLLGFEIEYSDTQNMQAVRSGGRKIDLNFFSSELRPTNDGSLVPHDVIAWTVIPQGGFQAKCYFTWHRITNVNTGNNQPKNQSKRALASVITPILRPFISSILSIDKSLEQRVQRHVEYRIPSSLLDTQLIVTKNASWYQPVQAEAVLETLYGTDWQTPARREEWFGFAKDSPK